MQEQGSRRRPTLSHGASSLILVSGVLSNRVPAKECKGESTPIAEKSRCQSRTCTLCMATTNIPTPRLHAPNHSCPSTKTEEGLILSSLQRRNTLLLHYQQHEELSVSSSKPVDPLSATQKAVFGLIHRRHSSRPSRRPSSQRRISPIDGPSLFDSRQASGTPWRTSQSPCRHGR